MKTLLKKGILLIGPLCVVLIFPVSVEFVSGEFTSPDVAVERQIQDSSVLYGVAYSDQTLYYKTRMAKQKSPEVLAIGNSKILTMRDGFFNQGTSFYNAGSVAANIASYRKFLEVTQVKPKVLIMVVEPLHFNPTIGEANPLPDSRYEAAPFLTRISSLITQSWVQVYDDYIHKKFTIELLTHSDKKAIGLNAKLNTSGMRNDGSYHYGKQYEDVLLRQEKINRAVTFIDTKSSAKTDAIISVSALDELDRLLLYCKNNNIYVIGYVPPTPKIIEDAYARHAQYEYIFHVYDNTLPVFKKYNFALYNFFSLSSLYSGDNESIDEYHTSEKVMLRTMIAMSNNEMLSHFVTKSNLLTMLSSVKDSNDVLR